MWEWMTTNTEKLGAGVVAVLGIVVAAWQWLLKARVERAGSSASVAIAESQREVYDQMKERLTQLEAETSRLRTEVDALREQLRQSDLERHRMRMHIVDLENTLRLHQIEPPQLRL